MKKTMITLAAMFAATVSMAAVTSQVVGYQTKGYGAGFTHLCPSFLKVTGQDITLSDLKGSFVEGESIQFVGSDATTIAEFFYLEEGSLALGATGWYADDFETVAGDTVVPLGVSLLYSGFGDGQIVFSGEVCTDDVQAVAGQDFNMFGNPFPQDILLSQIQFVGISEGESIQFVDADFVTASEIFYLEEGSLALGVTGWYADDFETFVGNTTVVSAGQGFLFNSFSNGATTITIPSPL